MGSENSGKTTSLSTRFIPYITMFYHGIAFAHFSMPILRSFTRNANFEPMQLKYLYPLLLAFLILAGCTQTSETASKDQAIPQKKETENQKPKKVILFFGNSLTAGYGLKPEESFPARIGQRLDSLGFPYKVVNSGVSGETTSAGLSRIDWVLSRQPVDIFVLELGANDGLRGIPPEETEKNLKAIIDKVQDTYPNAEIILAGMMVPPNMGSHYSQTYEKVFPEVAEDKDVALVPFLLEDVGGVDSLNQDDGIHPNARGAQIMAQNVWDVLKESLERE